MKQESDVLDLLKWRFQYFYVYLYDDIYIQTIEWKYADY